MKQANLPHVFEEDRERVTRRAFARLWLSCRDVAKRKRYPLDVEGAHWKKIEMDARS